ncbi:BAH domain-containing protein [Mycena venus]|uniref:DNA (cytosine-5-)-methyltransferase n=1 Tax=Mycena venus TaxID=2733690 RepID=A0A8H7CJA3_9AGAR|nr:BAH domain-containing protein [Mycena venus]
MLTTARPDMVVKEQDALNCHVPHLGLPQVPIRTQTPCGLQAWLTVELQRVAGDAVYTRLRCPRMTSMCLFPLLGKNANSLRAFLRRAVQVLPDQAQTPPPTKKVRGNKDVDATASRLSNVGVGSSIRYRPGSPTVSDFADSTICFSGEGTGENENASLDDEFDSSITSATRGDGLFRLEKGTIYVVETSLSDLLHETTGDGLPIRCIRDFTIFDCDEMRLINAEQLLDVGLSDRVFGASGIVESVRQQNDSTSEDDEEDDDETQSSGQHVELLTITGFNVHSFDDDGFDENIYIKTSNAWYILDTPSLVYKPYWKPLWVRHQLAHRVLSLSLDEPRTTEEAFIKSLTSSEVNTFKSDEVVAYITGAVVGAIDADAPFARVPLIRVFTDRPLPVLPPLEHKSTKLAQRAGPGASKGKKEGDSVPLVTPIIKRVLEKHLTSPVCVVGSEYEEANAAIANELHDVIEHHGDPQSMRWKKAHGQYSGVEMDGVVYRIGDVVAVAPGSDGDVNRAKNEHSAASHCVNEFANNVWFIRIIFFFDHPTETEHDKPRKMLHGQWFQHGSRTILQETSHSQELFLLNECDNIAVATIFQKCDVRFPRFDEPEEPDKSDPEARNYFCRFLYDDEQHSFMDPPVNELSIPVHVIGDGLALHGRLYHVDDYVYVKPNSVKKGLRLFIARVININCGKTDIGITPDVVLKPRQLRVRFYERHPDDPERRLYRTRHTNCVNAEDLDGLCFVRPFDLEEPDEVEAWVSAHEDHFYTDCRDAEGDFKYCEDCFEQHCEELRQAQQLVLRVGQIPVLEVFSGAGGLSQGLGQSGILKTEWAVEKFLPAAKTFALNHPETNVLCADINDLLTYSVELRDGERTPSTLQSSDGQPIPDDQIPKLGQVGLREDDTRSSLPFTMLSVAEVYKPNFFLLENVTGMLQHKVTSKAGDGRLVEKAMLKLIIRGLIALNYQVRFKVLQAGQHGAPQDRERLIFFGANRGCKLPEFPIPTHAFPKPANKYRLFIQNDHIPPAKRGRAPGDDHIYAPHDAVTVDGAIGDLPSFDWANPNILVAQTPANVAKINQRIARGIPQFDASKAPVGYVNAVPYASPPTTRYQRAMRRANQPTVQYHYTAHVSTRDAEAACAVPLKPYANHKLLPKEFFVNSTLKPLGVPCFGRLDGDGPFKTAVTTVQPRSRGSYVLHPHEHRAISVLDAKRAQGFPDHYILFSDKESYQGRIKDYYRHIGNAVPVPLAAALGRSLEAAFVETWKRIERGREESPQL